jgi:catechol 2,3-dioxygenase-like lactoylglutathione lyase family enzyme
MGARMAHTGLTVSDLERSLGFWRDALGMVEAFSQEKQGGYLEAILAEPGAHVLMTHLEFPGGGHRIELFEFVAPEGQHVRPRPRDVGFSHVCVAVDDIEAVLARLLAAGGQALSPPIDVDTGANRGGRGVYVRDPDGHVVELFTPPPAREEQR